MANQLVFMDTEFTSFANPKLISIGLAASTGEEFYAEVPYRPQACSEFVRDVVIPLLRKEALCDYDDLHRRLISWFSIVRVEQEFTLCYDSHFDELLFKNIFDGEPPRYIRFREVSPRNISELLRYQYHVLNRLPEHHALNDACALRYAFRERLGRSM